MQSTTLVLLERVGVEVRVEVANTAKEANCSSRRCCTQQRVAVVCYLKTIAVVCIQQLTK